jgi:hypothetical protein
VTIKIYAISLQVSYSQFTADPTPTYISCPVSRSHCLQGKVPRVRPFSFLFSLLTSFHSQKENVVPCSDGAGEIVAVGEDVKGWKIGDRVSPNFAVDHIHGDVTEAIKNTGLGGQIDGVLKEYINVPAHVSC